KHRKSVVRCPTIEDKIGRSQANCAVPDGAATQVAWLHAGHDGVPARAPHATVEEVTVQHLSGVASRVTMADFRSGFENDDALAGLGQLTRNEGATRSRADDDCVAFFDDIPVVVAVLIHPANPTGCHFFAEGPPPMSFCFA